MNLFFIVQDYNIVLTLGSKPDDEMISPSYTVEHLATFGYGPNFGMFLRYSNFNVNDFSSFIGFIHRSPVYICVSVGGDGDVQTFLEAVRNFSVKWGFF